MANKEHLQWIYDRLLNVHNENPLYDYMYNLKIIINSFEKHNNEYYLQDNRSYVGNDILWWAKDGKGYTTDLSKAEIYTKESAVKQHQCRETDIPWPKKYIDHKTRPAVDMQYVDIDIALQGTGIELIKPEPYKKSIYKCHGCGQFMSESGYFSIVCENCGCDNRP